jgi:hypothetical protein
MRNLLLGLAALLVLGALVYVGLVMRMMRRGRQRDRAVRSFLQPIIEALNSNRDPDPDYLAGFAAHPLTRARLYDILEERARTDLFPERYYNAPFFAEADLVYWLAHPNELGQAPDEIELMGTVRRTTGSKTGEFYVFRFRTQPPHWAAPDGWLAGIAGPYETGAPLATMVSGTFSRLESFDGRTLEDHVTACLDPGAAPALMLGKSS